MVMSLWSRFFGPPCITAGLCFYQTAYLFLTLFCPQSAALELIILSPEMYQNLPKTISFQNFPGEETPGT